MGAIKGDTRSLDYSSCGGMLFVEALGGEGVC